MDLLTLIGTKLVIPLGKLPLKNWLENEVAAELRGGLAEIAAPKIPDRFHRQDAAQQFGGMGRQIFRQLLPLFERQI